MQQTDASAETPKKAIITLKPAKTMKRLLFLIVIGMALTAQAQRQKTATPPLVYNVENTMAKAAKPKMLPANELPVIR